MISLLLCLGLSIQPRVPVTAPAHLAADTARYVKLTLYNPMSTSIPLVIPGVMYPNLSPMSRSGVTLAVGQPIYYVRNGRRELIYRVPADLAPGSEVDFGALVGARNARR